MDTQLKRLLGKRIKCRCGRVHSVPTRETYVGVNAKEHLTKFVADSHLGQKVLIVGDKNTFTVAGESLSEYLSERGLKVSIEVFITPHGKNLHAEQELGDKMAKEIRGKFDFAVAVGSGTINDLVKYACDKAEVPYISYPTAPSMNGYTSPIAALSYKNTKKTLIAKPPVAVIADIDVLCNSPLEMILAGLGDGISKSVCNIDWEISSLVKKEYFCPLPGKLMAGAMDFYMRNARGIGQRRRDAIKGLFEALNLAGISMVIAGSSAPASGGEHLISHFFDMFNYSKGKEVNLHGQQVGIATLITARLYEKLLNLNKDSLKMEKLKQHYIKNNPGYKSISRFYGKKMAAEVYPQFREKSLPWRKKEKEIRFIINNWSRIKNIIEKNLIPETKLRKALKDAGAPVSFSEFRISKKELKKTILHAREIRSRYAVLDLAYDFGILEEFASEE